MGTKADHDLWGQALAVESQYGDRGPEVVAQRILELRKAGEVAEAAFWSQVVTCLNNLHAIRYPGNLLASLSPADRPSVVGGRSVSAEDSTARSFQDQVKDGKSPPMR